MPTEADHDPTNLTAAYLRYRTIFESLLDGSFPHDDLSMSLSASEIEEFKVRHSDTGYLCHWAGCMRASTGFRTAAERLQHESSHTQQFRCKELGCLIGFTSRQALRRHHREYHVTEEDWVLPDFVEIKPANGTMVNTAGDFTEAILPDYDTHWYMFPNVEVIRRRAVELAKGASKMEMQGILDRIGQTLMDKLAEESVEPLAYHFRKMAQKEFRIKQVEMMNNRRDAGKPFNAEFAAAPGKAWKRAFIKNTVKQARLEAEELDAEFYVDDSISIVVDEVLSRVAQEDEAARDSDYDPSQLWAPASSL
jgi:hypothetical protein